MHSPPYPLLVKAGADSVFIAPRPRTAQIKAHARAPIRSPRPSTRQQHHPQQPMAYCAHAAAAEAAHHALPRQRPPPPGHHACCPAGGWVLQEHALMFEGPHGKGKLLCWYSALCLLPCWWVGAPGTCAPKKKKTLCTNRALRRHLVIMPAALLTGVCCRN